MRLLVTSRVLLPGFFGRDQNKHEYTPWMQKPVLTKTYCSRSGAHVKGDKQSKFSFSEKFGSPQQRFTSQILFSDHKVLIDSYHVSDQIFMSHFAYACKTERQNGISRLISELLRTLDSSLRDRLFVLQNEVF